MSNKNKLSKVAFVTGVFPAASETFIIDQATSLLDRGIEVEIFSFAKGNIANASEKFFKYNLADRTHWLEMPASKFLRILHAFIKLIKVSRSPRVLMEVLNFKKHGGAAYSLKILYWVEPFIGRRFDIFHCHFGPVANKYIKIKDILKHDKPFVTSFYGYDVSNIVMQKGIAIYDRLKIESALFLVMSNNMKERVVALGFDEHKVVVMPIGVKLDEYEFSERSLGKSETVKIISVGRFVEKKGFDDLLRALSVVKRMAKRPFTCTIVGGGPLESVLMEMTDDLKIKDIIDYRGYMKIEEIIKLFGRMHFFVQPSKTAANGDME